MHLDSQVRPHWVVGGSVGSGVAHEGSCLQHLSRAIFSSSPVLRRFWIQVKSQARSQGLGTGGGTMGLQSPVWWQHFLRMSAGRLGSV